MSEFCPNAAPSEGPDAEYPLENAGKIYNRIAISFCTLEICLVFNILNI